MATAKQNELYLTELILSIQNEVQSAVDYIADVVAKNSTDLGKSAVVMNIENLRVKLPFLIELEQKTSSFKPLPEPSSNAELLKKNLTKRKGLLLSDTGVTGKMAVYTKVKVLQSSTVTQPTSSEEPNLIEKGEIEIVFTPVKRE